MRRQLSLLLLLALLGTGCATWPIRAQVLDAETRQPIAGAVVLGVWTKIVGIGLSHSELVGVAETEADADGRFELERRGWSSIRRDEAITVYRFGYVAWSNIYLFPTSKRRENQRVPKEILLERFPPGESHQRHMDFISDSMKGGLYGRQLIQKFSGAIERERNLP